MLEKSKEMVKLLKQGGEEQPVEEQQEILSEGDNPKTTEVNHVECHEDYDPVSCNADDIILDNPKPLPTEPPKVKPPPPVLRRIKTPSLPSGKSTSNISLFLQTKQQKDEAELFYELGHTAFNNFFQRNVSRAQILVKAKEESMEELKEDL